MSQSGGHLKSPCPLLYGSGHPKTQSHCPVLYSSGPIRREDSFKRYEDNGRQCNNVKKRAEKERESLASSGV